MEQNLSRAVKAGMVWVAVERAGLQAIHIASTMVLARLLFPADFGVMGIAILFTGLSSRLVRFGFGMAIVQRETIRPDHVASLFVLSLGINTLICLVLVAVAPLVGTFFENPLVGPVLAVLSLNFIVRSFGVCPTALLRREMNFRAHTVAVFIDAVVKTVVIVVLALLGYGVWSLVYGELAGAVLEKLYLVAASGWRPSLRSSRAAIRDLFGFGLGVSLKSTFIHLSDNADNFIVGKCLGAASLGFYEKAFRLMDLPVKEISGRMGGVLFPAFAKMQKDRGRLRAAFRKSALSLSLACFPLFATLLVLGPQVIEVMYGPRWSDVSLPFQILCLAGMPRILSQIAGSALNATGLVGAEARQRAWTLGLILIASWIGSRWGISGVAVGVTLVNVLTLPLIFILLRRAAGFNARDFLGPQAVPLVAALAMAGVELAVRDALVGGVRLAALPTLALAGAAGGLSYLACVHLLRTPEISALLRELLGDLRPLLGPLLGRRDGGGERPWLSRGPWGLVRGVRRPAKSLLLRLLWCTGAFRLSRWYHRKQALILTYHGVLPRGADIDPYLSRNFVDEETFRWQMRFLSRHYRVVKLRELARWLARGEPLPPRCVTITFDDGFRNNLDVADPVLRELGLPCTIFLTTGCVDGEASLLWTERLSLMVSAARSGSVSLAVGGERVPLSTATSEERVESSRALVKLMKGVPPRERSAILGDLERQLGVSAEIPEGQEARYAFLDWERVQAADPERVDFGAHTVNHPILSTLSEEELCREVEESKRRIEERSGRPCDLFSYPNGTPADFGEREQALLRRSGFLCAVSQIPGLNGPGTDLFRLRRNNVGLGHDRLLFQALTSGLWSGRRPRDGSNHR